MNTENIKDSIQFGAILIFMLFLINKLLVIGVSYSDNAQTGKVNRIINNEINAEIVVFGASVAEVGIDPNVLSKRLSKSVYNAGVDGTAFLQYKCLIEELIKNSNETKYIILAVTYFDFLKLTKLHEPSRFYAHLNNDYVYNSLVNIDYDKINKMRYVPFYSLTQYTHVFYKNSLIGWRNFFKGRHHKNDTLNGFIPHRDVYADEDVKSSPKIMIPNLTFQQDSDLLGLKDEIKRAGKELIIVFMPMYVNGQKAFSNLDETVTSISNLVDRDFFVDFSKNAICNDKRNFYNNNHLNTRGARLVSDQLAIELMDRQIICPNDKPMEKETVTYQSR